MARAFGNPYDPARISLFETLFQYLKQEEFGDFPEINTDTTAFKILRFLKPIFQII